jgi:hypothetical protein
VRLNPKEILDSGSAYGQKVVQTTDMIFSPRTRVQKNEGTACD